MDSRGDPRALRYIIDHLAPGAVIRRDVRIVNKTADARHLDVYPAAATIADDQFQFGAGRAENDLTSWTTVSSAQLDVPAGGQADVTVTIQVPLAASTGERYAVIWASTSSDPAAGNVTAVNRVGIRVYLDIGAGGEPATDFTLGRFVAARDLSGRPTVSVPVTNTGGRAVDLSGTAALSEGPAGTAAGPFPVVDVATLAPGQTGTVVMEFPADLPNGPWLVTVTLSSGTQERDAAERLSFPDAGQPATSGTLLTNPWLLLGGGLAILLLILAVVVFLIRRSRSAARRDERVALLGVGHPTTGH